MVSVVQLVRTPDCGSGGRQFESAHLPHGLPLPIKRGLYASLAVSFQKPPIYPKNTRVIL